MSSASLSPALSVHKLPAYACLGCGDLLWEEDASFCGIAVGSVVAQYLVLNRLHVKSKDYSSHPCHVDVDFRHQMF